MILCWFSPAYWSSSIRAGRDGYCLGQWLVLSLLSRRPISRCSSARLFLWLRYPPSAPVLLWDLLWSPRALSRWLRLGSRTPLSPLDHLDPPGLGCPPPLSDTLVSLASLTSLIHGREWLSISLSRYLMCFPGGRVFLGVPFGYGGLFLWLGNGSGYFSVPSPSPPAESHSLCSKRPPPLFLGSLSTLVAKSGRARLPLASVAVPAWRVRGVSCGLFPVSALWGVFAPRSAGLLFVLL